MSNQDVLAALRRAIELVMPNLRHYYRVPRKGLIVKSYASDGSYWADVQPLRNDESADKAEPVISRVEIPVLWGGPERGVVCPPAEGTLCDITYYDGDPNYPRISNFRWQKNSAPGCDLGAFIIQQRPGVYIEISAAGQIINTTDADKLNTVDGDKIEEIGGQWQINVIGTALITSDIEATVQAPQINLVGNMSITGTGGGSGTEIKSCDTTQTGSFVLNGDFTVNGNINSTGTIMDGAGNSNHHSHP